MEGANRSRRFTILDGMIFIAAVAGWLAIMRPSLAVLIPQFTSDPEIGLSAPVLHVDPRLFVFYGVMVAIWTLTPAFLVARLRKPRPPLRDIIWQPGFMACFTAEAIFLLEFAWSLDGSQVRWILSGLVFPIMILCGWAGAWATGRLRLEPSWLDRLGCVLGVGWCLYGLSPLVLIFLSPLPGSTISPAS